MSREVKRVAMDFEWPLNKIWEGYINPHCIDCPDCSHGITTGRERLEDLVNLLMLSGTDARFKRRHTYFNLGFLSSSENPSSDLAELTAGLADREADGAFGHDACDRWSATKKIIQAAGLDPETWGVCPACKGSAIHPDHQKAYDEWEPTDPPAGEGYQMWENVSDGSPISPVFATPEELARWLVDNKASAFGSETASYEGWLRVAKGGYAPSMVSVGNDVLNGVDGL